MQSYYIVPGQLKITCNKYFIFYLTMDMICISYSQTSFFTNAFFNVTVSNGMAGKTFKCVLGIVHAVLFVGLKGGGSLSKT